MENEVVSVVEKVPAVVDSQYTNLIAIAVEKGTDINQLEKLMDLEDRWDKKRTKKLYLAAMSGFQSSIPVIQKKGHADYGVKNGTQGAKYDYAKLEDITEGIKPMLKANGLSYDWDTSVEGGIITVTCTMSHEEGFSKSTSMSSNPDSSGGKNGIQQTASAISYMKRYTLSNIGGITVGGYDDDAQSVIDAPDHTEVEECDEEFFNTSFQKWEQQVLVNNKEPIQLIGFLRSKGLVFSKDQENKILNIGVVA